MIPFQKLERWSEQHHSAWMDVLRVILGLTIMMKGFMFIADTSSLMRLISVNFGLNNVLFAHIIAIVHLLTGFLLIVGLATRTACLIQIPIILGAIFFVNLQDGGERAGELLLSIVVLLLLVFYFIVGSGRFSVFYYMINSRRSRTTDESRGDYQGGSSVSVMDDDANIL